MSSKEARKLKKRIKTLEMAVEQLRTGLVLAGAVLTSVDGVPEAK